MYGTEHYKMLNYIDYTLLTRAYLKSNKQFLTSFQKYCCGLLYSVTKNNKETSASLCCKCCTLSYRKVKVCKNLQL